MKTAKPLSRRFLGVIFLSVVVNLLMSLGLVVLAGTFRHTKIELYEDFASQISREADGLDQLLDSYATSAIIMANNVDSRIKTLARQYGAQPSELHRSPGLTDIALDFALSGLAAGFSTGDANATFFILRYDERRAYPGQPGIYLKAGASSGLHFTYERGPRHLAESAGIPIGASWQQNIVIDGDATEKNAFFEMVAAKNYDHFIALREDGHWIKPHDILNDGNRSVSYLVPLIGDDGDVYAILGIAIDIMRLTEYLKLPEENRYGTTYYISRSDARESPPGWTIAERKLQSAGGGDILDGKPVKRISLPNGTGRIGEFDVRENDNTVKYISYFHELNTRGGRQPNAENEWALIGFAQKSIVLRQFYNTIIHIAASLLVAVIGAGLLIYILAKRYFDQIADLSRMVGIEAMKVPHHLDRTNIEEIDNLADAIEDMSRSVSESTLRVATILDLLEIPIGGYEVRSKGTHRVFVTPSIKSMLALKDIDDSMYMDLDRWNEVYGKLKAAPYEYDEDVYCWCPEGGRDGVKYFRVEEMTREDATIGVLVDVTSQILKNLDLEYRASFDSLTKLYNRAAFKRKAMAEIRHATDRVGVMIFGDLDGLKKINDVYGHSKGDLLIQTAADMMATLEPLGGIVARLSGDEFAAYVHGFDSREEAIKTVLQHMSENFKRSVTLADGVSVPISISRGLATYPSDSDDFSTLLSLADYTMYQAKYARKGSVRVFDKGSYFNDEVLRRKSDALAQIIEERSMGYAFQPVYDIKAHRLAGYGVYLRPPSEELNDARNTLDIATISGNQGRLEKMIFEDILAWMQAEKPDSSLMICLKTIKNYIFGEEEFEALCRKYPDILPQIMVMIPAGTALDEGINRKKIRMFRECGAQIALDGIGDDLDESLEMLKLGPDMVKIDISHIRSASAYKESKLKLDSIIMKCRQEHIRMLAMQIETKSDYETALRFGFDLVQGYYIGYPQETLTDPGLLA